jgi:hypothetical protein
MDGKTGTYGVDNLTHEQNFVYGVPYEDGREGEVHGNAGMREGGIACLEEGSCSCLDEAGGEVFEGGLV